MAVVSGQFNSPGVTGNQVITAVGFRPALLFLATSDILTPGGLDTGSRFNLGVATASSNQFCMSTRSVDAVGTSDEINVLDNTNIINIIGPPRTHTASFVQFEALGFTINWGATSAGIINVSFIAFDAASAAQVDIRAVASPASPGTVTEVLTFTPDCLVCFGTPVTAFSTSSQASASNYLGWATDSTATEQFVAASRATDALATTDTHRYQRTVACIACLSVTGGTVLSQADLQSFNTGGSPGYTLDFSSATSGLLNVVVAIRGGPFLAQTRITPGATGIESISGVPFAPDIVAFNSVQTAPSAGVNAFKIRIFGAASSAGQVVRWSSNADAVGTTVVDASRIVDRCYQERNTTTLALVRDARVDALQSDGYDLDWLIASAGSEFGTLLIGSTPGIGAGGRGIVGGFRVF